MRYLLWSAPILALMTLIWGATACDDGNGGDGDADGDSDIDWVALCGEVGERCDDSLQCPEYQVCVDHECDCAYDRNYEVHITSAAIHGRKANNDCWDGEAPDCLDPDPYVTVKVGDDEHTTNTKTDTTNPMWDERFEAFIGHPEQSATGYWLTIYDEDPEGEDDVILNFPDLTTGWPIYVDTLRMAGITVNQGGEKARTTIKLILSPLPHEGE